MDQYIFFSQQDVDHVARDRARTFMSRIATRSHSLINNNKKFRSFKSKENIYKKKLGQTMVSAIKASSVTLIWQKEPEENTVNLQILITAVVSKTDMSKNTKIFQIC